MCSSSSYWLKDPPPPLRLEGVTAHLRHARWRVRAARSCSRWRSPRSCFKSGACEADWLFLWGVLRILVDGGGAWSLRVLLPAVVFSVWFRGLGEAESPSLFGTAERTGTWPSLLFLLLVKALVWRADEEVVSLTRGVEGGLGLRRVLLAERSSFSRLLWEASVSPGCWQLVAAGGSFSSAAWLLVEGRLLWTDGEIEFITIYARLRDSLPKPTTWMTHCF